MKKKLQIAKITKITIITKVPNYKKSVNNIN